MYIIGYVLKPHGIKGEVKIDPVSSYPDRFKQLNKVFLQINDKKRSYSIEKVRVADRFIFIKFFGINSPDDAELLRDAEVLIEAKDLIQPSPDEYFIHDLIGCRVITEDGEIIGTLTDVYQISSNDVYVVNRDTGEEILLPAIKDVVKRVDMENKQIIIKVLEGLLE
jgi:16S rRNA processing protein RimM